MLEAKAIEHGVGLSFAKSLDEPFVTLCGMTYSRREIVDILQLANMNACRRLEKTLRQARVSTIARLAETDPGSLYRMRGCGSTQLFVAMSLLWAHGYDPVTWWDAFDERKAAKTKRATEGEKRPTRGIKDTL